MPSQEQSTGPPRQPRQSVGKMDENYAILMFLLHHTIMGSKVVLTEQRCGPFCWKGGDPKEIL